jgi:hypothetical protein
MREQEMRMRVFQFLRARMRNMLMPATLGLGLAVGACADPAPIYSAVSPDASDSNPPIPIYGLFSDVRPPNLPDAAPDPVDAATPPDTSLAPDGRDGPPDESVALDAPILDTGGDRIWVKYGAPDAGSGPDVRLDSSALDTAGDVSGGGETSLPVRYAAVMPPDADDAPRAMPLYLAPPPREG